MNVDLLSEIEDSERRNADMRSVLTHDEALAMIEELRAARAILRELSERADGCYPDTEGNCSCHYSIERFAEEWKRVSNGR